MWDFIVTNLPAVLCAIVGIGLLIVEAFMPGFGVAGFSGIVLEVAAVVLMYVNHGAMSAAVTALIALSAAALALTLSLRSATKGRLSRSGMILNATESAEEGYVAAEDAQVFLDKEGVALTTLRPTGVAEFDGVRLNVLSDGEYVPPETHVKVVRVEGSRLFVRPVNG